MSEFDNLERQLRESVRDLRPAPTRPRWRRRGLLLILVPTAVLAGAAGAAGILDGPSIASRANTLQQQIRETTAVDGACRQAIITRSGPSTFTDAKPLPELVRALPNLSRNPEVPISDAVMAEALRAGGGATVLRSTVRLAKFPDGVRLLFLATTADKTFSVTDPAACAKARLAALDDQASDTDPAVIDRARDRLSRSVDTDPAAQAYRLVTRRIRPDGLGGGGSGSPVQPGQLPIRVRNTWGSGTGGFYAFADPRARTVRVQRVRPGAQARVWRGEGAFAATIKVREGLFGFFGRGGTAGRYLVTQYDHAGDIVYRRVLPN